MRNKMKKIVEIKTKKGIEKYIEGGLLAGL